MPLVSETETVRSFWHGPPPNSYLLLCLHSFVRRGCPVEVFSYAPSPGFPEWIMTRDAREIVPAESVLAYRTGPGAGSPSLHSNLFRFAMLERLGGWWIDMDVALLRGRLPSAPYYFATEADHFANSVLKFPKGHPLLAEGAEHCRRAGDAVTWGTTGPTLFTSLVHQHKLASWATTDERACPIIWTEVMALFDPAKTDDMVERSSKSNFVHLFCEMWRRIGIPRDLGPPVGSFLDNEFRQSGLDLRFAARIDMNYLAIWVANERAKAEVEGAWAEVKNARADAENAETENARTDAENAQGNVSVGFRPTAVAGADRGGSSLEVIDVSLVLALHREGHLLRRTLLSLTEAAQHARAHGIAVELVTTLDRADELTGQALKDFDTDAFDASSVLKVDHGSLGPSRNSGIAAARGHYIYTCDGDDLISFNSIVAMFRLAKAVGRGHLIFHEYLCAFGDRPHCWKYFPLDAVSPLAFLEQHPYTSGAFAHRSVFEAVPYLDAGISSAYAYEDWHFNAECVARGFQIVIAKDTIRFYRQHRGSLMDLANQTTRQILPSTLFKPQTWVHVTCKAYERLAPLGACPREPDDAGWSALLDSAPHLAFIQAANAIDPGIDPATLRGSPFGSNLNDANITTAIAYHEICQVVGAQRFDEVFLLPFISTGGAERYIGDVMQALYDMRPTSRMLVLLGERLASRNHLDRVPPNATVLDLANDWPQLTMAQHQLIVLKLIQSTAPQARLHLRSAWFAEEFYRKFKPILRSNPAVYYRFTDIVEISSAGNFARPWGFNFISEHAQDLALIVTDNEAIIACDRKRIGIHGEKWRCLPARVSSHLSAADAAARGLRRKGRVLWASRLDRQKRPELLARIAKKLETSDIQIDVFGSAVLDAFNPSCFAGLANLSYRGAYDGFAALDHSAYDAFLYTTAFDGMPNVVLEAIAAGLPVIAPDIGGIAEIIVDGDSGLLLPALEDDDEMAAAYAAAITRLADDSALRAELAMGALKRLADRHNPLAFSMAVRAIFDGPEGGEQQQAEHVAFLEERIAELRRVSLTAKARATPQAVLRLREIESSRGYRLLQRYYALASAPLTKPLIDLMRGVALRVLRLMRRVRAAGKRLIRA